jgi:hypothetical protein
LKLLAIATLAAAAGGFGAGWAWQGARWEAADGHRAAADAEAERLQRQSMDRAAARHELERARLAAERRVITREVERVISVEAAAAAAVCLGPDGLRVIAEAVAGARDPGQPAAALPSSAAAR